MNYEQAFINALITAGVFGIVGGGIGYFWWKFKKTDSFVTRTECRDARALCEGSQIHTLFKEFRHEMKEDLARIYERLWEVASRKD